MKQKENESYLQFLNSVRLEARRVNLTEIEQVTICISGAKPTIRIHLAMQAPKTFKDLLNLPVARDESLCEIPAPPSLDNIAQDIRALKDTIQAKQKVQSLGGVCHSTLVSINICKVGFK